MPPKPKVVKAKAAASKKKSAAAAAAAAQQEEQEEQEETENEDDGASDTSSTIKRRKDRKLSDVNEVKMLEFLKVNTCMWDMKKLEYRNAQKKNDLWEELADSLEEGVTAAHLKAAFKNLRNWYTKLDKDATKSGTAARTLTGRDIQVQERMQFMKNSVTHRPAPMTSAKAGGPNASDSVNLIQSVDDQALLQPPRGSSSPNTKRRRTPSSVSASTSADADTLEGLQTVMSRNAEALQQIYSSVQKDDDASPDLDNPLGTSRAIKKSFCQYVTNCVLSYDEGEFDRFQSGFTAMHARFKAERRREVERRAAGVQLQSPGGMSAFTSSQPTISSQTSEPVPFQLYGPQADSQQYQAHPSQWISNPPSSSLYNSQTPDYNAQYRFLQQQQQLLRQQNVRGLAPAAPPPPPATPLPRDPQLPNITRLQNTSTPKRPRATVAPANTQTQPASTPPPEISLDLSNFLNPEQDSQQDALDQLE